MAKGDLITADVIDEIKQRNEIVSVVEGYVHLTKKSSANLFGLCPFHSEKTPSFSVSPSKQIFYCFGCHKGGDVIHFIMDIEKLSYIDALRYLAEKSGVRLPESDNEEYRKRSELRKQLFALNTEAARFFYRNLIDDRGKTARDYMSRRGIDVSVMRKFGIGYAPDSWDGLMLHLQDKGIAADQIFMSGLVRQKDGGRTGGGYDLFRNRLIFPIFDQMGRIVAFGGRVMDDSMPKYINSPETPVYTKGRHLYGFNLAKTSKAGKMLVVEGYMDLIAAYQAGVDFAVASLGTALTEQQSMLIRNYSEEVVICYDSDTAGQNAAMRGLDILKKKGCRVSVLRLEGAKDPDEYIRKFGAESFRVQIGKALPLMDYKLLTAYEASIRDGSFDKIGYQDRACDILASEENIVIRELYSVGIAEKLGVSPDNILAETERRIRGMSQQLSVTVKQEAKTGPIANDVSEEEQDDKDPRSAATREELMLICVLSNSPSVFNALKKDLSVSDFSPGIMRDFIKDAISLGSDGKLSAASLLAISGDEIVNDRKLAELIASGCMKSGELKDDSEAIDEAKRLNAKIRIKRLQAEKNALTGILTDSIDGSEDPAETKSRILELEKEIMKYK